MNHEFNTKMKDIFKVIQYMKNLFLGLLCFFVAFAVFAQDSGNKHKTYLGLKYRQADGEKTLIASLTARIEGKRGRQMVSDREVAFYLVSDTSEILLGNVTTNADGKAIFQFDDSNASLMENFYFNFLAVFKGDNEYNKASEEMTIKSLNMNISFREIDSVRNILVSASYLDEDSIVNPAEEDVVLFVPGKFSRLKIGEIELEEGEGSIEFPVTLPGDSIGKLRIIAVVEESDDFGTVEISADKDWGKPRPPVVVETRRGLGDTDAPLWMVYTLIVLMSAVWFHYLYLFFMMYMIKQKGKST